MDRKVSLTKALRVGKHVFTVIAAVLFPVLAYLMQESFVNSFRDLGSTLTLWFNIAFLYIFELLMFSFTFSPRWACALTVLFSALVGTAQYMVLSFRSLPICPWDLLSIGTALSVVDNYKLEITKRIWFIFAAYLLLIVLALLASDKRISMKTHTTRKIVARICVFTLCVPLSLGYVKTSQNENFQREAGYYPYLFTPTVVYKRDGFYFSFASLLKYLDVSEPDGYNASVLSDISEKYKEQENVNAEKKPNVIVIMNESFSDLSVLGNFETDGDSMPFIRSLSENTVKGQAYVSVKGGNTPNSEWEFLTGDSMAFLPAGSIPYQQYIRGETPTFMTELKNMGYKTYGIHPYNASGWKRNTVYPLLGIDNMIFNSEFVRMERIRQYTSDKAVYEKVIRLYNESLSGDDPVGIFCVTMQNHGGYTNGYDFDNFTPDIHASDVRSPVSVSTYLSLVKKSDEAFEYLVDYFKTVKDPTVILMFGDHEPNSTVTKPLLDLIGIDENTDDWNVKKNQYVVPFVIWANYDIDEKDDVVTSLNYLNILLSETAGFELTGWQKYRKELSEKYPVITANFAIDGNGTLVTWEESSPDDDATLAEYHRFQYNHMFDRENLIEDFY